MATDTIVISPTCKICNSEYCAAINDMIIQGKGNREIGRAFPQINLNEHNVANHRNHFKFKDKAVEAYKKQQSKAVVKVVSEIQALDETYTKAYEFLAAADFETTPPRKLEVVSEMMMRAIQTKADLCKDTSSPGQQIQDLFSAVLKTAKSAARELKDVEAAICDVPPVIEATFTEK